MRLNYEPHFKIVTTIQNVLINNEFVSYNTNCFLDTNSIYSNSKGIWYGKIYTLFRQPIGVINLSYIKIVK